MDPADYGVVALEGRRYPCVCGSPAIVSIGIGGGYEMEPNELCRTCAEEHAAAIRMVLESIPE